MRFRQLHLAVSKDRMKYWEIIADYLSKAGWTWGLHGSLLDSRSRSRNPSNKSLLRFKCGLRCRKFFHAPHVFILTGEAAWEQKSGQLQPHTRSCRPLCWEVCSDIF